jgi:hypothetical protein
MKLLYCAAILAIFVDLFGMSPAKAQMGPPPLFQNTSCPLPWGDDINNNNSVTAYQSTTSTCTSPCTSQTRLCSNGILTGSFTNQSCASPLGCCQYTWTKQTGAGTRNWAGVASSADGMKLVAVNGDLREGTGDIYTSTDGGVTWVDRTSAGVRKWNAVASSSDGVKLAAAVFTGDIYTSADSGATWTDRTGSGIRNWMAIASSANGVKLVAVVSAGFIYTSANSGASWTAHTGPGPLNWKAAASTSDGSKLAVAADEGVYTSSDSGATWILRLSSSGDFSAIAYSADGSMLAAGDTAGHIYVSSDSGATWAQQTVVSGSAGVAAIASCADGSKLMAVGGNMDLSLFGNGSRVMISLDRGATWTAQTGSPSQNWSAGVASSADGSKIVAGKTGGNIYTGTCP